MRTSIWGSMDHLGHSTIVPCGVSSTWHTSRAPLTQEVKSKPHVTHVPWLLLKSYNQYRVISWLSSNHHFYDTHTFLSWKVNTLWDTLSQSSCHPLSASRVSAEDLGSKPLLASSAIFILWLDRQGLATNNHRDIRDSSICSKVGSRSNCPFYVAMEQRMAPYLCRIRHGRNRPVLQLEGWNANLEISSRECDCQTLWRAYALWDMDLARAVCIALSCPSSFPGSSDHA